MSYQINYYKQCIRILNLIVGLKWFIDNVKVNKQHRYFKKYVDNSRQLSK